MSKIVELIAVGTELLLGNIANTDAQMLSEGLSGLGLNVYYHTVVGDNPERLAEVVEIAKKRADIIITTGGLGPTYDDLTKNVLAECFGKTLVEDADTLLRIQEYFKKINAMHRMTPNNAQQALLPEGCTIFTNDWGTAPGCAFFAENTHVLMLPGPPRECSAMYQHRAVPYLQQLSEGVIASHTLKFYDMGEAELESKLRDRMNTMSNPTLAPYAKEGECLLRLTAKANTLEEAETLMAPIIQDLKEEFPIHLYGVDVEGLAEVVVQLMAQHDVRVSVAESCTAGLFSKLLTDVPGVSKYFAGGMVTYNDQIKNRVLGVPMALLEEHGAVSEEVALEMGKRIRTIMETEIGIGITGIAGPTSDHRNTPIGTFYIAVVEENQHQIFTLCSNHSRDRFRLTVANKALNLLRKHLLDYPPSS